MMRNRLIPARIITVDTAQQRVAVMPLSQGMSHSPVQPVVIPLGAFRQVRPIPDRHITYQENEMGEFIVHSAPMGE